MRKTTIILLGFLLLTLGVAYYEWTIGYAHVARLMGDSKVPVEVATPPGVAGNTPQKLMDEHRARYHLPPDARLVLALQIVSAFPDKVETVAAPRYQQGTWQLKLAHGDVTLPELPGFDASLTALRQQAKGAMERVKLVSGSVADGYVGFEPTALLQELHHLNSQAASGISPALLVRSAELSCRLAYSTPDATHTADELAARCLAMTVLAEAATEIGLPEPMSIAATLFDFTDNALVSAAELPENHPWRAYLERNDTLLESNAGDPYAGYLLLRRYAARQMGESWRKQLELGLGATKPHQLMTVWQLSEHGVTMQVMVVMPTLLWPMVTERSLPAVPAEPEGEDIKNATAPFDLLAELGSEAAKASSSFAGPVFTAEDYQGVYRAYLYSSLYRAADTALTLRGSKEEAEAVYAMIASSKTPEAIQFANWYKHLIDAEYGRADTNALRKDLKETTAFGSKLVIDTANALNRQYEASSAQTADLLNKYCIRLDSRLTDRKELASLADQLLTLGTSYDMYASLVEQARLRYPSVSAWYYDSRGEMEKVKELAFDKRVELYGRTSIQRYLANQDVFEPHLAEALEATSREDPLDWNSRSLLVTYLKNVSKFKEARDTTSMWLKSVEGNSDLSSFDYWQGSIELSEIELKLGNKEQAWMAVEPHIESNYGPLYSQAMKTALAMGRVDRATELARAALKRYPDNTPLMSDALEVAWAGGFYGEAAAILRGWSQPAHWSTWRKYFSESFAHVMVNKPQEAHQALDELIKAGNNTWLLQTFADAISEEGNPQLAYEIQGKLISDGAWKLPTSLRAYSYLKKVGDVDDAVSWLRGSLRGMPHDYIAMGVMENYRFELLWNMTEPANAMYPTAIWLYRAVGYITGKEITPEQIEELKEYYQSTGDDDRYDLFGKYLMGFVTEERVRNLSLDRRGLSEAAYYLGLGAARDKRYRDMVDWMRVCLDTREERNGEYRFAATLLTRWREGDGVDALAKKGMLF